jgi:hypothetical protein
VRPPGQSAPYSRQNCPLCFDEHERCSTGTVSARIAREWLDSHPNVARTDRDDDPTLTACPACEKCPYCRGTHMVDPRKVSEIRKAIIPG